MASSDPQIVKIESSLGLFITRHTVRATDFVAREIYDATPVASGYAQSNWVASIGRANTTTTGSKEAIDGSRFFSSLAAIARWSLRFGNVYITNAVDYIGRLANGSSAQAPSGFIDAAAARGLAKAKAGDGGIT